MSDYWNKMQQDFAEFQRCIRKHRMTVKLDQGVYRHLTFQVPGSSVYRFDLVTTPGYLTVTGDMGSWVFSRTLDMFEFFSKDWTRTPVAIDYRYWAEKCEARSKTDEITEYDKDALETQAREDFQELRVPSGMTFKEAAAEVERFEEEVLEEIDGDYRHDVETVMKFEFEGCWETPFQEFYEYDFKRYSYHFKWICWAIAWGIKQYELGGDSFDRQRAHDRLILDGKL